MSVYEEDDKPMVGSPRSNTRSRRRCCIISILSVALVILLTLALSVGIATKKASKDKTLTSSQAVGNACSATSYPEDCRASIASSDGSPQGMSTAALSTTDTELASVEANTANADCRELLVTAREQVQLAIAATGIANATLREEMCVEVQTGLSAALEGLETCITIFTELESDEALTFPTVAGKATRLLSNALALLNCFCLYGVNVANWKNTLPNMPESWELPGRRRLLNVKFEDIASYNKEVIHQNIPTWLDSSSAASRHLLARPSSYNVIVAKDGTGKFKTVNAAIQAAPKTGKKDARRYIIYVKAGTYDEQIIIPKKLTNLMIIGDGIDQTIFTGNRNVALMRHKKMTTFASATMIVSGAGFTGKYFTVRNTAGAAGHQAVAIRVSADRVAHYMVKFDSYQDTLYCHSFRQFYRNCIITGTVDFVFGNGNAVFQNCQLMAKKSTIPGQQNTYTAQGRTDPHQNTGLAFQDCSFDATPDLKRSVAQYRSFLGRPWKKYSVCVLLRPTIQAHVHPSGWMPWNATSFGLWTSFFAEYQGKGPGADTKARVKWSHQIRDVQTARKYQAESFIKGTNWLPDAAGVPYSLQPL